MANNFICVGKICFAFCDCANRLFSSFQANRISVKTIRYQFFEKNNKLPIYLTPNRYFLQRAAVSGNSLQRAHRSAALIFSSLTSVHIDLWNLSHLRVYRENIIQFC